VEEDRRDPRRGTVCAIGQADRRRPGDALITRRDERDGDRDHEGRSRVPGEAGRNEQWPGRNEETGHAGEELDHEPTEDDRPSSRRVADRSAEQQERLPCDGAQNDENLDLGMIAHGRLDRREGWPPSLRIKGGRE
jgi:hypothetical protein